MLQDIVQNIPGFIFRLSFRKDKSTYWSYISQKGIEMLDMPEDIITRKNWKFGQRIPEKYRHVFLASVNRSFKKLTKWDH